MMCYRDNFLNLFLLKSALVILLGVGDIKCLRIELTGQTEEVTIAVRSRIEGTVNLLTGEAMLTDDDFQWITPYQNTDGSFEAIIYPQEAASFRDGDGSLLKITKQGKEYYFKAPDMQTDGNDLDRFEAGKQITVKLSLKESTDTKWANKKVWVYGIPLLMRVSGNNYIQNSI